jgi:hypothetical protein
LPAREAFAKKMEYEIKGEVNGVEEMEAIIQSLEPEPDSSDAYSKFMEEKMAKEDATMEGDMEMMKLAKEDRFYMSFDGRMDKEMKKIRNEVKKVMAENKVNKIDFGELGNFSWAETKKGRRFSNNFKDEPSPEFLEEVFLKINTDY